MRFAAPARFERELKLAWTLPPFLLLLFLLGLVSLLHGWINDFFVAMIWCGGVFLSYQAWRRGADYAIRQSEERLRISQQIAHIGSWDWDVGRGTLDCSEELCSILAIPPADSPSTYQGYLALLPEEERNALAAAIDEALAGSAPCTIEHRLVTADGAERVVSELAEVFRDRSGAAVRVVGVVHDVTERKEAENALFFERRYRDLIEKLPQRIFLKDCNSVYLSCSSSFARELGREPGDIFGKTDYDLFPAKLASRRLADDARVMAAGVPEERDELRQRDGSWVSMALIPLKDETGAVYGLLGILTDITFRKLAEQQLRESEERFRTTFEQAAVGICHLALDGTVIRINRRYCEILGYAQEELLGRTIEERVHPDDLPIERDHFDRLLSREIDDYTLELRQRRNDGSVVWVSMTMSILCSEDGEPRYLAAVVEDVTAKREAQTLRQERDLVQAASVAKSQFLAGMSHEIRTPMNAIIGLGRLALQTELTTKQREYLEKICSSGQTLLDIINDILDFSKIEAGRLELERTIFSMAQVLSSISDMLSLKAHEKGIGYGVRLDPELPKRLVGDPLRLTQVLNNLVCNAVKFTERGEVIVDVKAVKLGEELVSVLFCVQDTGVGLSEEQIEKIFTPFTQADSSTTRRYGGTGLGLSISSQLVELMEGKLRVDSLPGAGSCFYFTANFGIPSAEEAENAAREQEFTLRMLVLGGEPELPAMLEEMLQGLPISCEFLGTVAETLALLEGGEPLVDLLMVDAKVAGDESMDGMARVCREISSRRGGVPIIAKVAAENVDAVRRRGDELGITAVVATPVRSSLMLDALVRALALGYPDDTRPPQLLHTIDDPGAPQLPAPEGVPLSQAGFQPEKFQAEAEKLERLLSRNSLDAKRQFTVFRGEIPQGSYLKELKAIEGCLDKLEFKKARQLLAGFPGRTELSAQERDHA
jgi:two-component system, sensor histidine kinase and response regulator